MKRAARRSIVTVRRRRSLDGLLPLTLFSSLGTNGLNSSGKHMETEAMISRSLKIVDHTDDVFHAWKNLIESWKRLAKTNSSVL